MRPPQLRPPLLRPPLLRPLRDADHRRVLRAALDARAAGEVPLVGDERWQTAHWDAVVESVQAAELPPEAAWGTFTSGSTSMPRVVLRTAESWELSFPVVDRALDLRDVDVILIPVHPVSSMALYAAAHAESRRISFTTTTGARLRASDLAGPTLMHGTPTHLRDLVALLEGGVQSTLRGVLIGGAHLDVDLAARARQLDLSVVGYFGAAELSMVALDHGGGLRAMDGVQLEIRNRQLWVHTDQLALTTIGAGGSLQLDGGWASVGDRAEISAEGVLSLHGRADDAILTAGATVVPADVEAQVERVDGVAAALVLGEPEPFLGHRVIACLEPEPGAVLDRRELTAFARATLTQAQRPRRWRIVTELPRTASGKVRRLSPEEALALPLAASPAASPAAHPGEVALVAGLRTPVTGRSRGLAAVPAHELAGAVLAGVADRSGLTPEAVVLGNCVGPGGNLGRVAALNAGFGESCIGWSVDAQCGSGLVAVMQAADHVRSTGRTVAAGGVESPSTAPVRLVEGHPQKQAPFAPAGFPDPDMTTAADDLAAVRGITRSRQEAFTVGSHERALASAELLRSETLPAEEAHLDPVSLVDDDGPRRLSPEVLTRFRTLVGSPTATVTPGTAARIADGAAAVMLVPAAEASGPHLVIRGQALIGGDPALPGLAAAPAVRAVLEQAGVVVAELAAIEVVEAYASQVLATLDDLGLTGEAGTNEVDRRVNAAGGALALGHPWGASGALALVRLMHRLEDEPPGALGVAACAIGGGMGAAMLVERRG